MTDRAKEIQKETKKLELLDNPTAVAVQMTSWVGELVDLRRIVKWACDTEDLDFFVRDNPQDTHAIDLLRKIVL